MTTRSIGRVLPAPSVEGMRRGACPALSEPMMTGDGLLARIALTDAVTPLQLAEICRLALKHGNGMVDISARGNLQVRGLMNVTAPLLEADVRALNLPLRDGLAVEVPPFAGLDETEIADPRPLAEAIRHGVKPIAGLAPKMSVVVDGHGRLRLSELLADIRLVPDDLAGWWKILLGGTERSGFVLGSLPARQAVLETLVVLRRLGSLGPTVRGRDLTDGLATNGLEPPPISPFGFLDVSEDLFAAGIGPAFSQVRAEQMIALCQEAVRNGIPSVRPSLDHSLLFLGSEHGCRALLEFAAGRGFITAPQDPRSHIAACPGSPACRSGMIETHAIAETTAADCAGLLDGSFKLHVSGCPKGCAHPQSSALALCGTVDSISLVTQGKAGDAPFASITFADTNAMLRRLSDLVTSEKRAGETSAACIARLGPTRLAAATGQS
ncbi:precorrin-3B synthase [Neorhizobium lilium]|uniref:Precorrin-3B synthase n=1 Tax=Neorhizobium lilium TaxID=2503024 RepID=A0A3S3STM1_9HYPH|nr:precorrin-3B synthase [Neorhizobium lilium]RWX74508.1 precorrin-3B synthase [Neorhizobium lilium]